MSEMQSCRRGGGGGDFPVHRPYVTRAASATFAHAHGIISFRSGKHLPNWSRFRETGPGWCSIKRKVCLYA